MMLRAESTTDERRRQIAAATSAHPLHATAAKDELLRQAQAEVDRLIVGVMHLLRYAGERDGKVPAPLLRRLVVGEDA